LSLVEGSTESATLVTDLIVGLRERGVDTTRPILVVIEGPRRCAARCSMCSTARCSFSILPVSASIVSLPRPLTRSRSTSPAQ
jgi:hypothetical protein